MSTHHDSSGLADQPDDRTGDLPTTTASPVPTQGLRVSNYDYYDDSGYTDPAALGDDRVNGFDERKRAPFAWNAGADLGLLIVRLALGATFVAHGAQKLFGVLGGPGPDGFARGLEKMGFRQSHILSLVTGGTELGAGALLILGLFTPLAAAGIVGVMANAVFLNWGAGFFATSGGYELAAMLGAVALGMMFTGPGRVALDYGRAWFRRPVLSGFLSLLIAAGSAAGVLIFLH